MKDRVPEGAAERLTGYSRSSLLKKRQSGLLLFERDKRTGRVFYDLDNLKRVCGLIEEADLK